MSVLDTLKTMFRNRGGRFSGRYRERETYYSRTYQWLADVPELADTPNPYDRAPDQWMSIHDQYRLQLYKFNRALYYGDHYNAFRFAQYLHRSGMLDDDARIGEIFGRGGVDVLFIAMNLFALTTDTFADLMTEALGPIMPDDDEDEAKRDVIKRIKKNSGLKKVLHRSVLTGSYKGDIVWTVHGKRKDDRGPAKVWIRGRRVDNWFPTIDPMDRTTFSEHAFCFQKMVGKKTYVGIERYLPGKVTLEAREVDGNRFIGKAPDEIFRRMFGPEAQAEYDTPDFPLVFHVPNKVGDDNDPYGDSDYGQSVLTLADELNHRITQLGHQLDKHGNLGMTGPFLGGEETANQSNDNQTNGSVSGKYIERDKDDPEPRYIEIPTQSLDVMLKEIDFLCEEAVRQMRMSPRLLGYKAGAAEEAFDTLRLACVNTLLRNRSRVLYMDDGLIEAIEAAAQLENEYGVEGAISEPLNPQISWGDGFPMDTEKKARIWQIRTGARPTATIRQAIIDMDGPEGATEKVDAIRKEEMDDISASPGFSRMGQATRATLNPNLGAGEAAARGEEEPEINAGLEEPGSRTQAR